MLERQCLLVVSTVFELFPLQNRDPGDCHSHAVRFPIRDGPDEEAS